MPAPQIATKTKPAALIIGGTVLALLLMWFFAYTPAIHKKADAIAAQQVASDDYANLSGQVSTLKGAAKNKATLADQVAAFVQKFPSSADQPGTFKAIQDAAKTAGVNVSSFSSSVPAQATPVVVPTGVTNLVTSRPGLTIMPAGTAAAADTGTAPAAAAPQAVIFPIQQIQVSIKVSGSMDQITRFIKILEGLDRPVLVSSVSVQGGGAPAGAASVTATASGAAAPSVAVTAIGSADIVLQVFIAKPLNPATTTPVMTTAAPTP